MQKFNKIGYHYQSAWYAKLEPTPPLRPNLRGLFTRLYRRFSTIGQGK